MHTPIPGGLLVAVEGIDGAGKTTQGALLAQYCGERGLLSMLSKEPTSGRWGQKLRESAQEGRLTLEKELDLFIRDRRAHISQSIQPMLDAGGIFIVDRYYFSTMAYQGIRGCDPQEIQATHEEFAPRPDVLLIFDIDPKDGLSRIRARGDVPNEFESEDALSACRLIFQSISGDYVFSIDGNRSIGEVKKVVQETVLSVGAEKIRSAGLEDGVERLRQLFGENFLGEKEAQALLQDDESG